MQRIQTLYLFIVIALMGSMFFVPTLKIDMMAKGVYPLLPFGFKSATEATVPISAAHMGILLAIVVALVSFIISKYKRRMLQVRLCFMLMVLLAGVQAYVVYYIYKAYSVVEQITIETGVAGKILYTIVDVFPVIAIILTYLAFRGIIRDEMLIRSLNRIR